MRTKEKGAKRALSEEKVAPPRRKNAPSLRPLSGDGDRKRSERGESPFPRQTCQKERRLVFPGKSPEKTKSPFGRKREFAVQTQAPYFFEGGGEGGAVGAGAFSMRMYQVIKMRTHIVKRAFLS